MGGRGKVPPAPPSVQSLERGMGEDRFFSMFLAPVFRLPICQLSKAVENFAFLFCSIQFIIFQFHLSWDFSVPDKSDPVGRGEEVLDEEEPGF